MGARGGAGGDDRGKHDGARRHLIGVGSTRNAPSGPPTGVPWEPAPPPVTRGRYAGHGHGHAHVQPRGGHRHGRRQTRHAASGGRRRDNRAGQHRRPRRHPDGRHADLHKGTWTGEPTTYAYQWKVDGAVVGTDAATHTVTAADVGKAAS